MSIGQDRRRRRFRPGKDKRPGKVIFSTVLDNAWFGGTVTSPKEKDRISALREHIRGRHDLVTFEPLFDDIGRVDLTGIDWVVAELRQGAGKEDPYRSRSGHGA